MTGITKKQQDKDRQKIEKAMEESMRESPASVLAIAEKTGLHPSKVHRCYVDLGWVHEDGRWVLKGK